ncbi:hypothetical protein HNQ93_001502 [Hymenobacter luteus]|uniref:Uncharacterized protein n=2 Tax=Hymenobacter TaxID=89966 RepID=A0A7W9WBS8_9BACT|nr:MULTISPECIES: hypothetical protein [Hymenobacter]MBB4601137.1 hypothetical protein [Hymenobacter latericoloratus]MBB6058656.1 hypothetical protein [Hymenobacter luteus]
MPISYKTLFLLEADAFSLVEIKLLDVQSDDPAEVYFWFRFDKASHHLEHLEFVAMNRDGAEEQREFRQGRLQFNGASGTFAAKDGASSSVRVGSTASLPPALDEAIQRYFVGA